MDKLDKSLIDCANKGDAAGVRAALAAGANPNASAPDPYTKNLSALMLACASGSLEAVRALVDAGADVCATTSSQIAGAGGNTPLHNAVALTDREEDRLAIVRLLLERGADPNAISDTADTPLTRAAEHGQISLCEALLQGGAALELGPPSQFTALHAAANSGQLEMIVTLLEWGAPIDALDATGGSALMTAAYRGYPDVVRELLARGARADIVAKDGRTALHYVALYAGNAFNEADNERALQIARELVAHGADPSVADPDGITAADLAAESDFPDVADLLRG